MRTIEELLAQNVDRYDMSEEEAALFINYWFEEYERTGFCETFHAIYGDFKEYDGKRFAVVERCNELNADFDALPMWKIRFGDEKVICAFPEEICRLEREV